MRILMLAQFYPPVIGGEERHVVSLSEALVQRGHEVHVATMPHPSRGETEVVGGVTIHSVRGVFQRASMLFSELERPHAPPFPDPEIALRLLRLAQRIDPDVVHGHNWLIHSYLPWAGWLRAGLVSTLHDYSFPCAIKTLISGGERCEGPSYGKCLRCAGAHFGKAMGVVTASGHLAFQGAHRRSVDHFIAVSQAVAQKSSLPDSGVPYEVHPTFIPDDVAAWTPADDPRLAQLPSEPYLLFVGELNQRKGVGTLVEAYARLTAAPPLVLIGRRCPDTPATLPKNVTLHESWPHALVMHAWRRCLFGLAPSNWVEPCGTIVMEANAVGKPMIATGHGGLAESVEDGRTGLLVPPDSPGELAEAMRTLIADADLRARLAVNALGKADAFMAKTVVPKIEAIYRKVCAARASPARGAAPAGLVDQARGG